MNIKDCIYAGLRYFYCRLIPSHVKKENQKKLLSYKDKYRGKRCFIIGNGPSLRAEDLELIKDEISFGMNHIYKIYDKTQWRPTFWCIQDMNFVREMGNDFAEAGKEAEADFIRMQSYRDIRKIYENIKNPVLVPIWQVYDDYKTHWFSDSANRYVYDGGTVTYMAMQLAAYMGFAEVYLLGVDFSFPFTYNARTKKYEQVDLNQAAHFYQTSEESKNAKTGLHFGGNDELVKSAYVAAEKYCINHDDFQIYNATRGGKLEIFPRVDFDSIVKKERECSESTIG